MAYQAYHPADSDQDGVISKQEIQDYIMDWRGGQVSIMALSDALDTWKIS